MNLITIGKGITVNEDSIDMILDYKLYEEQFANDKNNTAFCSDGVKRTAIWIKGNRNPYIISTSPETLLARFTPNKKEKRK